MRQAGKNLESVPTGLFVGRVRGDLLDALDVLWAIEKNGDDLDMQSFYGIKPSVVLLDLDQQNLQLAIKMRNYFARLSVRSEVQTLFAFIADTDSLFSDALFQAARSADLPVFFDADQLENFVEVDKLLQQNSSGLVGDAVSTNRVNIDPGQIPFLVEEFVTQQEKNTRHRR